MESEVPRKVKTESVQCGSEDYQRMFYNVEFRAKCVDPGTNYLLILNRVCCVFTPEKCQFNNLKTVSSLLLVDIILPHCDTQRNWRSCSQLEAIKANYKWQ